MSEHNLPLDRANFASLWVETFFYGVYSVLFAACVYVLIYANRKKQPDRKVNIPMLVTATIMYALSTTHMGVNLAKGVAAFVDLQTKAGGALGYYQRISLPINILKQALYATNNIVADSVVIYRCYIIWNYSYLIIISPIVLLLATSVCAYLAVYNFSQVKSGQDVFALNIAQWGTALFSLSLVTNILVTSLIAGRIWWLSRATSNSFGTKHKVKYNRAIAIIIESGAIYSVSLIILLTLYSLENNAQYIAYDALSQVMGIVPTLIIVRVGLGVSTDKSPTVVSTKVTTFTTVDRGDPSGIPASQRALNRAGSPNKYRGGEVELDVYGTRKNVDDYGTTGAPYNGYNGKSIV